MYRDRIRKKRKYVKSSSEIKKTPKKTTKRTGWGGRRRWLIMPMLTRKRLRIRHNEYVVLGAALIFGLIVLILIFRLIAPVFFTVKINLKDVQAMRIAPVEISYIYELAAERQMDANSALAAYLMHNRFFKEKQAGKTKEQLQLDFFSKIDRIRSRIPDRQFAKYNTLIDTLMREISVFPVQRAESADMSASQASYMYGDTWSIRRELCGTKNHVGCDIFDRENIPGRLAVLSISGGIVENTGKNGRGGRFVGIRAESGNYYLYDNLDGVTDTISRGASVAAGAVVGYMGSGNGGLLGGITQIGKDAENVSGRRQTGVHIGIRVRSELSGRDFWINPYPFLRFIENAV